MIRDPEQLPIVGPLLAAGPEDTVFDLYVLTGPVLIVGITIAGRNVVTRVLAGLYVGLFVVYLGYKALTRQATS